MQLLSKALIEQMEIYSYNVLTNGTITVAVTSSYPGDDFYTVKKHGLRNAKTKYPLQYKHPKELHALVKFVKDCLK